MDIEATELELLGAAIGEPRITASTDIAAKHFLQPANGAIWEAVKAIHAEGHQPTPTVILDRAQQSGVRVGAELLPELVGKGVAANADLYASQIQDAHRRRGIESTIRSARQALDQGQDTDRIVSEISKRIDDTSEVQEDAEDLLTIDEFVDQDLPPEQWVVPGLFTVGERLVLTGDEGSGKSMLMRQIGLCAAAGINPFTFHEHRPARVLFVDAENPKATMVKKFKGMRDAIHARGVDFGDRCWVQRFPQGMDLADSRDRLALHNLCMLARPELLVIGPAYKLYIGGANSREEDLARQVTWTLDGLREEFGFALVLEHHSPHENSATGKRFPRPIGSSLWRRWPEYGFGLVQTGQDEKGRTAEIRHWRGMRDERPWPTELESGGRFPWTVTNPEEVLAQEAAA